MKLLCTLNVVAYITMDFVTYYWWTCTHHGSNSEMSNTSAWVLEYIYLVLFSYGALDCSPDHHVIMSSLLVSLCIVGMGHSPPCRCGMRPMAVVDTPARLYQLAVHLLPHASRASHTAGLCWSSFHANHYQRSQFLQRIIMERKGLNLVQDANPFSEEVPPHCPGCLTVWLAA